MNFTPMTPDHLDQVVVIENECFPASPWPRRFFEEELSLVGRAFFLVALESENVVGYGGYCLVDDEMHITNIAVKNGVRRRGVGRKLTELLIGDGLRRGAKAAHLEVRRSNLAAQELYSVLGFKQVGERIGYYQQEKEDAILMSADL